MKNSTNQCQGCQANWPRKPFDREFTSRYYHLVEGGYEGEKIVCTRDRYKKDVSS